MTIYFNEPLFYLTETWTAFVRRSIIVQYFIYFSVSRLLFHELNEGAKDFVEATQSWPTSRSNEMNDEGFSVFELTTSLNEVEETRFSLELDQYRLRYQILCQLTEKLVDIIGLPLFMDIGETFVEYVEVVAMFIETIFEHFHFFSNMKILRNRWNDIDKMVQQFPKNDSCIEVIGSTTVQEKINVFDFVLSVASVRFLNVLKEYILRFYRLANAILLLIFIPMECNRLENEVGENISI